MAEAAQRREAAITSIAERAVRVRVKVKKVLTKHNDENQEKEAAIREKLYIKMDRAAESKENQQLAYSKNMQLKMDKIMVVKERAQLAQDELGEALEKKMREAAQRKDKAVAKDASSVAQENRKKLIKIEQLQAEADSKLEHLEVLCQNKQDAASQRKRETLGEITMNVAQNNKKKQEKAELLHQVKHAELTLVSKRLNERLQCANERKEFNLAEIVAKVTEQNTIVADRVEEVHRQRNNLVNEIQCKIENKLESATKRKDRQEKTTGIGEKIERGKLHRLAQDADLSSIQQKLDEKILSANQRKELNMLAKVAKAAEGNRIVSEKVQEVQDKRASATHEIQSKSEMKLESATKRKEMQLEMNSDKIESFNVRREKVLQALDAKQDIEIPKAKELISVKLEEAAARREKILLEKAEQAGFVGSRSRTNSEISNRFRANSGSSSSVARSPLLINNGNTIRSPFSPTKLEYSLDEVASEGSRKKEAVENSLQCDKPMPFWRLILTLPMTIVGKFVSEVQKVFSFFKFSSN